MSCLSAFSLHMVLRTGSPDRLGLGDAGLA